LRALHNALKEVLMSDTVFEVKKTLKKTNASKENLAKLSRFARAQHI